MNKTSVKKRPAKRVKKEAVKKLSTVGKLLQLKYHMNDTFNREGSWRTDMSDHKSYIMTLINDVRKNDLTKIAREDMQLCNRLWKIYATD